MRNAHYIALSNAISRGRRASRMRLTQRRLASIIRQMFSDQRGTASVEFAIVAAAIIPPMVLGGYELGPVLHQYAIHLVEVTQDACATIKAGGGTC